MSGRLRHLVTVQSNATSQDGQGQQTISWTKVDDVWAQINPVSGADYFNQSGEHADVTHKILVRHGVTVLPGYRILFGARIFDVRSVLNQLERNRYLQIMAVERVR